MYLKSLVLKGFKSFADRSVLSMEPGITAIVGPNGSGKSNISDAVLWVLGERNAKNLRGQVMEDVIFAGSSARKSVGVAEVTLVLDNSDGSLPVDFNEVAITRRMYRNGESDYLINNTLARRMDVLDILHDSGLGTGTHSIISQGHLDNILASRPEDRRALIEEAAGVLKHKQRKAKSQRKLDQMDQHLARVNDVVKEVERNLGPLQRKARRAMQYEEVSAQLKDVKVLLAVDDLRTLQHAWDEAVAREKAMTDTIELANKAVHDAEAEYERLQSVIRQESSDVAALATRQTRAASLVERFESTSLLLTEKKRSAALRSSEISASLEANEAKRAMAQKQRDEASRRLDEVVEKRTLADRAVSDAQAEADTARRARSDAELDLQRASRRRNEVQRQMDAVRRDLAAAQEKLAGALGRVQAAEGLDREFSSRVSDAQAALDSARKAAEAASQKQQEIAAEEAKLRALMIGMREKRDDCQHAYDKASDKSRSLESQIKGLEEVERTAAAAANPARAWILVHTGTNVGRISALSKALSIDPGYEPLVEAVLGDDSLALIAEDTKRASAVAQLLDTVDKTGSVALMMAEDAGRAIKVLARDVFPGRSLTDKLHVPDGLKPLLDALVGDVVICASLEEALQLHASDKSGLRFVANDGSTVWPNGKVMIVGKAADQGVECSLSRLGRIARLKKELDAAREEVASFESHVTAAREQARHAQEDCLACSQRLADAKGAASSASREVAALEQRVAKAQAEQQASMRSQSEANSLVDSTRPRVDSLTLQLQQLESDLADRRDEVRSIQQRLEPARAQETKTSQILSEARLKAATLSQQESYERHVRDERSRELVQISEQDEAMLASLTSKQFARKRTDPLLDTLSALTQSARSTLRQLTTKVDAAQEASVGAHSQASAARDAYRRAQEDQSAKASALSTLREDKVRLEMRVQAAVDAIVREQGVPLEQALEKPPLEDRAAAEDEVARLSRRIANMGIINPDAAHEYEELKERYDYLRGQLADLASARTTLRKINAIIDERMRDDFAHTFNEVNGHFQTIFSELFPGGTATLSLVDPEDLENTGVEVTAQPRGKRISKMSLMSGGEKSLVALALLFAVYRTRTTPFYILDEVEAALDDSNLRRLTSYLQNLRHSTQLIMITHQRRTMEMADVLFGVSMQADGVTQVLSQRLEKALQYAE